MPNKQFWIKLKKIIRLNRIALTQNSLIIGLGWSLELPWIGDFSTCGDWVGLKNTLKSKPTHTRPGLRKLSIATP